METFESSNEVETESTSAEGENEGEGDSEKQLRYRKKKKDDDMFTNMEVGSPEELPCHPNIIICIILSFMFIIILLFIYSVYYLIMYKRTQDELERMARLYPFARGNIQEDEGYVFKPLRIPSSIFTPLQNDIRDRKFRLVVGTLWDRYSSEVEKTLELFAKQMVEAKKHHNILMFVEHYEYNIHTEPFRKVASRGEEKDGNFLFLDAAKYRFKDHFRDNKNVNYTTSKLPESKQRQLTCDTIAMITHILRSIEFEYYMFFSFDSDICDFVIDKIIHGITFFKEVKEKEFCALKFSKDINGMVLSKSDLINLVKYMQSNLDKYPMDKLIHDFIFDEKIGKYKTCRALGGYKEVYSFKENLFYKKHDSNYPYCYQSMSEIKFDHIDDVMYQSRCELKKVDFSPCLKL